MITIDDFDPQNVDDDPGVVTRKTLPEFKQLYEKAVSQGIKNFRFKNRTVNVDDAKFILQNMGAYKHVRRS